MIQKTTPREALCLTSAALLSVLLNGCGLGSWQIAQSPVDVPATDGAGLGGSVRGGPQPVAGSSIQLYAAGTADYGSGATPLIPVLAAGAQSFAGGVPGCVASALQTCYSHLIADGDGNFNITGDYTCPSATSQIYLVAQGGNSGAGTNAQLALMAALGPCSSLPSSTLATVNEVTTMAAITAFQQFMSVSNG